MRYGLLLLSLWLVGCGVAADVDDDAPDAADESIVDDTADESADVEGDDVADVADVRDAVTDARDAALRDIAVDARDAAPRDVTADARDAALRDVTADARDAAPRDVTADARDAAVDARDAAIDAPRAIDGGCPPEMALVNGSVCVDRWEEALEATGMDGGVAPWSPYVNPGTRAVRAVSREGQVPQGYIGGDQAETACRAAGKRLCVLSEWLAACRGPENRVYPYGNTYVRRQCNEARTPHPVIQFFGTSVGVFTFENMNNPGINMQDNTVYPTGAFTACVSPWGVFDMVGNLHEWIRDSAGTFKGGFYVDAEINGHGCLYTTTAHALSYHDYSTGFRCCAAPR